MSKTSGYAFRRLGQDLHAVQVEGTGPGRWRLLRNLADSDTAPWPEDLTRKLARDGTGAAWVLPEDLVSCNQTPMPRLKRREMVRAVEGWVARQEGGVPDDWAISWRTHGLASGHADAQQVAMAYARRTDLATEVDAASAAGLRPTLMLPPSLIIDQFFRQAAPECGSQSVWNLVFVGGTGNALIVANQDGLLLTRPLPDRMAGDEAEYLDRLATEVDRSVFFARQTAGSPTVDGVYVLGDDALADRLVARLHDDLEVACHHWRLDTVVDCQSQTLSADEQLLVMAAAVTAGDPLFNLAPSVRRGLLGPVARRRVLLGAVAGALAVVPLLIAGGEITKSVQERYLRDAEQRLAQATVRARHAAEIYELQRQLNARQEYLAQYRATRHDLQGIMHKLAVAAPASVRFRELNLVTRGDGVVLQLTALASGRTVSAAQESFMAFQRAVVAMDQVMPLGEPRQLQIGEVDTEGSIQENVLFTMDCRLILTQAGEEG